MKTKSNAAVNATAELLIRQLIELAEYMQREAELMQIVLNDMSNPGKRPYKSRKAGKRGPYKKRKKAKAKT